MTTRFPSVPLADDPELAEHALWNDEIAADLEVLDDRTARWEAMLRSRGFAECPCGLALYRRGFRCPCGAARCGDTETVPVTGGQL